MTELIKGICIWIVFSVWAEYLIPVDKYKTMLKTIMAVFMLVMIIQQKESLKAEFSQWVKACMETNQEIDTITQSVDDELILTEAVKEEYENEIYSMTKEYFNQKEQEIFDIKTEWKDELVYVKVYRTSKKDNWIEPVVINQNLEINEKPKNTDEIELAEFLQINPEAVNIYD